MNFNIRSPSNNQRGSGRETILYYTHKKIDDDDNNNNNNNNNNNLNKSQFLI